MVVDDDGVPVVENHPEPLLAGHGEAFRAGGVPHSALVRERGGWTLTSRQEIHPAGFAGLGDLLAWLAARAADRHRRPDGSVELGGIRAYEDTRPRPLLVRDGSVTWPS
ncbi:hypothetical protein [Streptomyces sp. NPDC003487]